MLVSRSSLAARCVSFYFIPCALPVPCRGFAGRDGLPRSSENGIHRKDGNRLIQGTRAGPNRMRRLLSDPLARTSYG